MKLNLSGFTPRPGAQSEALAQLGKLTAKYVLLSAPVGSGKTKIAMAAARGAGSAFIVSPQNILLDQYAREFHDVAMVKGRSHYQCHWAGGCSCADASDLYEGQHTKKCEDYIPARDAFWESPISVTNLHYAAFAHAPDGALSHRELLVVDECHGLEPMLRSLFHIKVLRKDCEALGVRFSDTDLPRLFKEYVCMAEHVRGDESHPARQPELKVPDLTQRRRIHSTARRLQRTNLADTQNPWHVNRDRDSVDCRPLFARNLAPMVLGKAERVLFMSATPGSPDHFFRNLGIDSGADTAFVEVDSDFPRGKGICLAQGAPYVKSANLDRDLPILADACAKILRQLPKEKGLILCASYNLARGLHDRLLGEFRARLILHSSANRDDAVQEHRSTKRPTVLLGVNMHEGLDMRADLARFLIIPKVLYSARDSWVNERERLDPGYYQRLTAGRMVQACGRVIRGPDDWAYIVVIDANMSTLIKQAPKEFPGYFHRAYCVSSHVD